MAEEELTPEVLTRWIPALCEAGALWRFYKTPEWQRLRRQVLARYHGECAWCAASAPSLVARAETVHHVYPVKAHPAWALSEFVTTRDGKRARNLVPLCHDCHDRAHQRMSYRPSSPPAPPLTPERW